MHSKQWTTGEARPAQSDRGLGIWHALPAWHMCHPARVPSASGRSADRRYTVLLRSRCLWPASRTTIPRILMRCRWSERQAACGRSCATAAARSRSECTDHSDFGQSGGHHGHVWTSNWWSSAKLRARSSQTARSPLQAALSGDWTAPVWSVGRMAGTSRPVPRQLATTSIPAATTIMVIDLMAVMRCPSYAHRAKNPDTRDQDFHTLPRTTSNWAVGGCLSRLHEMLDSLVFMITE